MLSCAAAARAQGSYDFRSISLLKNHRLPGWNLEKAEGARRPGRQHGRNPWPQSAGGEACRVRGKARQRTSGRAARPDMKQSVTLNYVAPWSKRAFSPATSLGSIGPAELSDTCQAPVCDAEAL
jgi:hypothetical protein